MTIIPQSVNIKRLKVSPDRTTTIPLQRYCLEEIPFEVCYMKKNMRNTSNINTVMQYFQEQLSESKTTLSIPDSSYNNENISKRKIDTEAKKPFKSIFTRKQKLNVS